MVGIDREKQAYSLSQLALTLCFCPYVSGA